MKRIPLIALAALPLTAGLVLAGSGSTAQTPPTSQSTQSAPAPRTASGTAYHTVFLQKLAAQLGITAEKLQAAAVAAGNATIDQAVKAGDLPSDHAAEMKRHLQERPLGFGGRGFGGPGGRGMRGHDHDHGPRGALPGTQGQAAPITQSPSGT
ncbi:hypothetical protein [Deinococcus arcticus]|uniref:DUF2680 domain-containing protein n=1 Tax=Deinococcus arcticus TaxID=2136176 RepID=A0A2T3WD36_9DEIO|nr:hypothetical protein [Deinococcus arcticus]PTA69810.1 hypothetical protein C8263_02015 [Deinococcus arcticus]